MKKDLSAYFFGAFAVLVLILFAIGVNFNSENLKTNKKPINVQYAKNKETVKHFSNNKVNNKKDFKDYKSRNNSRGIPRQISPSKPPVEQPKPIIYTHSKDTKPNLPRPRTTVRSDVGVEVELIYSTSPEGKKYVTRRLEYDKKNNVVADIDYYQDGRIYYQEFYEYYESGFVKTHTHQVVNGGGTPNYIEYFDKDGNKTRTDYYDITTGRFLYSQ